MYTLRKISKNNIFNQTLGGGYAVVSKEFNEDSFKHYYKSTFNKEYNPKNDEGIVKFIITDVVTPIYETETVYVMTDSGKTFECLNSSIK